MSIDAPLYKAKRTNLTLLVGEDETPFEVHRKIVTQKSKFFEVACSNPHFREGIDQRIKLPEIDVGTVTRLLRWIYQAPLGLPQDIIADEGYEITLNLLNAADFLEIPEVVHLIREEMEDYLWKCSTWSKDREEAAVDEQRKVDLLCRIYECGAKIDEMYLKKYLKALKGSHNMGLFMNMVKDIEDCHHDLFRDIMVAVYSTVDGG